MQVFKLSADNATPLASQDGDGARGRSEHCGSNSFQPLTLLCATLLPLSRGGDASGAMDGAEAAGSVALVVLLGAALARGVGECAAGGGATGGAGRGGAGGPFMTGADFFGARRRAETPRAVAAGMGARTALAFARLRGRHRGLHQRGRDRGRRRGKGGGVVRDERTVVGHVGVRHGELEMGWRAGWTTDGAGVRRRVSGGEDKWKKNAK